MSERAVSPEPSSSTSCSDREPDASSDGESSHSGDSGGSELGERRGRCGVVGPPGPTSLGELFNWAGYNASVLLETSPSAEARLQGVRDLLSRNMIVNESYSGMGTGAYTLHIQHKHFLSVLAGQLSVTLLAFGAHCSHAR